MQAIRSFMNKLGISGELMYFLWHRKLWWFFPMMAMLLILGLLLIFAQGTGIAPFIYTLF